MLRTFNMGIGLIVACDPAGATLVLESLVAAGETAAAVIGRIGAGGEGVRYAAR
jgi:phosphoribosylaminoimidazole (AIR) synthetase